jgi:hypothetical protein
LLVSRPDARPEIVIGDPVEELTESEDTTVLLDWLSGGDLHGLGDGDPSEGVALEILELDGRARTVLDGGEAQLPPAFTQLLVDLVGASHLLEQLRRRAASSSLDVGLV